MSEKEILTGSFLDLSVFIRVKKLTIVRKNIKIAMDKVRLHREMLKRAWFSIPRDENAVETREIRVVPNLNKDWFIVKITTDVKSYYHSSSHGFTTLSEAVKYAKERNKENNGLNDYTKYKLIIE